ncbi:MAG: hypothetical protein HONBIEJF_02707 [Fimbriimonadaceae bacterium]|nr:hypothetical protein [Fimbriimonadaceae bacterium]
MKLSQHRNLVIAAFCATLCSATTIQANEAHKQDTPVRMMNVDARWGIVEFNVKKGTFSGRLSGEVVGAKSVRGAAKAPVELMIRDFNPMTELVAVDLEPLDDKISVIAANVNGAFAAKLSDPPGAANLIPKDMENDQAAAEYMVAVMGLDSANRAALSLLAKKDAGIDEVAKAVGAAKIAYTEVEGAFKKLLVAIAASQKLRVHLVEVNEKYSGSMPKYAAELDALDRALRGNKTNVVIQTQIPAGGAALRIRIYDKLPTDPPDPEKLGVPRTYRLPLVAKKGNSIIQFQAGLGIAYASVDNRTFTAEQQLFPDGTPVLRDGRSVYRVRTDRDDKLNFPVIGYVHFRFGDGIWLGNDFALTVGTELVGSDPFKSFVVGLSYFPAGFNDIVLTVGVIVRQRPTLAPGLDIGSEIFTSTVPTRNRFTSGLFVGVSYRIGG